jgi:hypothetical protein
MAEQAEKLDAIIPAPTAEIPPSLQIQAHDFNGVHAAWKSKKLDTL